MVPVEIPHESIISGPKPNNSHNVCTPFCLYAVVYLENFVLPWAGKNVPL